jgi:serine/threonine protein kinase
MSTPDPLRAAPPAYDDPDAKRARAGVAAALFGGPAPRVRVGRYELIGRLGAGGMGVVHRAHDPELDRPVAVKLLRAEASSDDKARARMLREARALAKLSHPNVITVYDVGTLESDEGPGQVFVAMELVAGKDLRRWLAERRSGSEPGAWMEVLEHFVAAGRGLQAAHEAGLIHRDFKPENVLVGDDGRVRVLDFGLARPAARLPSEAEAPIGQVATGDLELSGDVSKLPTLASQRGDGSLTETGAMLGTPLYMAPELYDGKPADAASDQFAFCASLWEGLYGRRPFGAETLLGHVDAVRSGAIVDPPSDSPVPSELHRILRRGLDPEPGRRFGGMHALLAELEAFVRQISSGSSRVSEPPRERASRVLVVVLVLVVLAALIAILGVPLGWFGGDTASPTVVAPQEDRSVDPPSATTSTSTTSGPTPEAEPTSDAIDATSTSTSSGGAALEPSESTGESTSTGESETIEQVETDTPGPNEPELRDFCHFHEDSYTLLARTPRKKTKLEHQGTCYECRVEQRRSRTENLSPRNCAGYLLCGATSAEACP